MIGGGPDAFIGAIHRMASRLDGEIELVCGVFCRDANRSLQFGLSLGLEAQRCYQNMEHMLAQEQELPAEQRMQFVVIVTPNHLHFEQSCQALLNGFHVLCDKPATISLQQALRLKQIVTDTGNLYGLTHTYNGYPMVQEAKYRVAQGQLGSVRKIVVEYSQGWLADENAHLGKQASWRLSPEFAGVSCCMADIGVHGANLAEYISGLSITHVCAQLNQMVTGRQLDDDGAVLLKFDGDIAGVLIASQVATGEENNLNIRIYGDKASLCWSQQTPDSLELRFLDGSTQLCRNGVANQSPLVAEIGRTPAGHPQGYIEAFANIYQSFAAQLRQHFDKQASVSPRISIAGIDEAISGMRFIEAVVASNQSDKKWFDLNDVSEG